MAEMKLRYEDTIRRLRSEKREMEDEHREETAAWKEMMEVRSQRF